MSNLSRFITAHTSFFNVFLPSLKQIVDAMPLPAPAKTAFDEAYALGPEVVIAGGVLLSELHGGAPQPAALELAGAFNPAPLPEVAPAPAPLVAAPVAASTYVAPPPAPAPSVSAPTVGIAAAPVDTQTTTKPAPLVDLAAAAPAPIPLGGPPRSVPDPFEGGQINADQLRQLAASLGLTVSGPGL